MNKLKKEFIVNIPANIELVSDTVMLIIDFFNKNLGLNEDMIFELKVVLNELIVNAIIHGNKYDCSKNVFIKAGFCKADHVYIIIEDEGEGIGQCCNISNDDAVQDIFLLGDTGRGLKIVSCLCDTVNRNKKGNKVIVTKKIL